MKHLDMEDVAPSIFPVQRNKEFQQLVEIYQSLCPKYIVEIGSYKGGSLWYWLKNAPSGAHVVSIDHGPDKWKEKDRGFDRNIWYSWAPENVRLYILTGESNEARIINQVETICPFIDFLFIDGGHRYGTVCNDYRNFGKLVKSGGIIALHDAVKSTKPQFANYGVWRLFKEIGDGGAKTELLTSVENQNDCGIGVVYV
jgi:predicted O-methyltransferase YrrM